MIKEFPLPPNVAGTSLSGDGTITITTAENEALCRSTGVEPARDGMAHPIWYFVATQVGMGKTVAGLCDACGFDVNKGPMMMGSRVTFAQPIRVDTPYRVEGEIKSLTRKPSRTLGAMDILDYELRLVPETGEPVAIALNSWALPRQELM